MFAGIDFFPADQAETFIIGIDFVNDLPVGDTITSGSWNISVADNSPATDPSPSSRLTGGPYISGTVISYRVTGLLPNVKYALQGIANTSGANTISLSTYIQGESVT